MTESRIAATAEHPDDHKGLWTPGFIGVLLTQFLGSFNDNLLRWLSVNVGVQIGKLSSPGMSATELLAWKTKMLTLGGVAFTLPYLFLMPLAGSLADRYSKRSVMIVMKVLEIVIMLFAVTMIVQGQITMMFISVGLMGAQSALFGPSRFGSMPEILPHRHLSSGNGFVGLATVVACALGAAAGYAVYGHIEPGVTATGISLSAFSPAAGALIGIAIIGTLTGLMIPRLTPGSPETTLKFNTLTETLPALKILWKDVRLVRTTFGIAFFWFLASLAQANADPLGDEVMHLAKHQIGLLLAVIVAGLGTRQRAGRLPVGREG
jgi:acyl-[acyl-carrier-protein]-phospholipid O-acyltransferase/long-chain-fatty-acid--[acyl-carrier-protein] ligase